MLLPEEGFFNDHEIIINRLDGRIKVICMSLTPVMRQQAGVGVFLYFWQIA